MKEAVDDCLSMEKERDDRQDQQFEWMKNYEKLFNHGARLRTTTRPFASAFGHILNDVLLTAALGIFLQCWGC